MVTGSKRIKLCLALIVANMIFIWGNSVLSADISSAISDFFQWVLGWFFSGQNTEQAGGSGLLRKVAHLTEFASLGLLWCAYLLLRQKNPWWGLLPGLCTACVDETIQCFVPGRGPRVTDVAIDFSGVILGIGVMLLIHLLKKWRNKQ